MQEGSNSQSASILQPLFAPVILTIASLAITLQVPESTQLEGVKNRLHFFFFFERSESLWSVLQSTIPESEEKTILAMHQIQNH